MTAGNSAHSLVILSAFLYLASSAGYILYLILQKNRIQTISTVLACLGFGLHILGIGLATMALGTLPVHNLPQNLSIAGAALAGAYILLRFRLQLKILGVFAMPLVTVTLVTSLVIHQPELVRDNIVNNFWLIAHILLIFAGEAALVLACGAGILYLVQEKAIKAKTRGFFFRRLPPLDLLDSTSYTCVVYGFVMLTMGLITGFVYAKLVWGRFWSWDPKEIWSAGTWLVYAALLHGRLTSGWMGRRSAIMTVVGFAVILFTFLGVNFLIGGHHQGFTQ